MISTLNQGTKKLRLIMPQKELPAKTWPGRVWRLTRERFPIFPNITLLWLQFAITFSLLHHFFMFDPQSQSKIFSWADFAFGSVSSVLFVYLLRVFDELKDYKTDVIDFPDRPLAAGLISLRDTRLLWIVTSVVLVLLAQGTRFFFTTIICTTPANTRGNVR